MKNSVIKRQSFIFPHDFHNGGRFTSLLVFQWFLPGRQKPAFGYTNLKMSETALPSTFPFKAIVMVILSPLIDIRYASR